MDQVSSAVYFAQDRALLRYELHGRDINLMVENMASSAEVRGRYMVWLFNHTWFVSVTLHVFLYTTAAGY